MPNIFKYDDLTTYLKAVYRQKNQRAIFSYRTISSNFDINISIVHGIFKGYRKITERYFKKFIDILELNDKEKQYFELLVNVSQSGMPKKLRKRIMNHLYSSAQKEELLQRAYVAWKQGATKGMAWKGLKNVFLEYERLFPEKRIKI